MYACVCHAVTEDEVVEAIDHGAASVEAVGDTTRAGTCCGSCHDHIEAIIDERCGACPLAALQVA